MCVCVISGGDGAWMAITIDRPHSQHTDTMDRNSVAAAVAGG